MSMRILMAVPVVALALAGCGDQSDDRTRVGSSRDATLAGEYVVTRIVDGGQPRDPAPGSEIRLTFSDGTLGLRAGCNTMSGDYTFDGARLVVGPIGGTEMGCPDPLMEQDTWLAGLFADQVAVAQGDPVTLTAGDVVLELAPRTQVHPDQDLRGARWVLDGVIEGDSVSSVPAGPDVVLTFASTDVAAITGLCNGWGSDVEVLADTVRWMPHMRTLMACADPARQQLDTTVSALLTGATSYEIAERTLTVTRGEQGLVFVAR